MKIEPERKQIFAERLTQACVARWGREYGAASRLSEAMGVTVATAARWLRGIVMPEVERWGELAVKLDVTVEWLTGKTHDLPPALRGRIDERSLDTAKRTMAIVLPMVRHLKADIDDDELEELTTEAYRRLDAGESEASVEGMLYQALKPDRKAID